MFILLNSTPNIFQFYLARFHSPNFLLNVGPQETSWVSVILNNQQKPGREDNLKVTTRCHITLGTSLVPDCTGLTGRENPVIYETREREY